MEEQRSLGKTFGSLLHRIIEIIVRFLLRNLIYGRKGQSVPPIKNPLLLESATELAAKIRTKKVVEFYQLHGIGMFSNFCR
jgi:fatty acid amide hydrolase 2